MKIQYCSDLHLEFRENRFYLDNNSIKPLGDILILAGDIMLFNEIENYDEFFDYLSSNFKMTYWIPGNHEYYHYDIDDIEFPLNKKIRENIILLNNQVITIDNIELIFCTLWSFIQIQNEIEIQQKVNDFRLIKNKGNLLTISDFNSMYNIDFNFLKRELEKITDRKKIIITHHVPTLMNYPEQYKNSNINNAFVSELYDFIESNNIDYWIYGHHHFNIPNFKIGKTTMLTNQLGYVIKEENEKFNHSAIIEL